MPRDGVDMRFEVNEQLQRTASKANQLPDTKELRHATLRWFQTHKPDMVKPKLVVNFAAKGWHVLFTPPYWPDVQPIELFWAAGKNHARALNTDHTRQLEEVVAHLREGWYGNEYRGGTKRAVSCSGLVRTAIAKANARVVLDEYLTGTVDGGLTVDEACELEVGVDQIGRATRLMSKRAVVRGVDDPAVNGTGARGGDDDCESDDDESDADEDE